MKCFLPALAVAGAVLAGCGQSGDRVVPIVQAEATTTTTTTTAPTTTTTSTTVELVTTTTVPACVPADTAAQRTYLDAVEASISQTEGAIAQIRLIIDNSTRDRAAAARYQEAVQTDRDRAVNAFTLLPSDTNRDKLTYQERRLADAKGIVASWDATLSKARGDLSRAQTQKATLERKASETRAAIRAAAC